MKLPRFNRFLKGGMGDTDTAMEEAPRWTDEETRVWRRERNTRWQREQDIARGYWEVSAPLTEDEAEELHRIKTNNDLYEEVQHTEHDGNTWREWIVRDPDLRERLHYFEEKQTAHTGSLNFQQTRLPPTQYYAVWDHVSQNGIGNVWVQFRVDDGFCYLKVFFMWHFQWYLTNAAGRAAKDLTHAGYHITLCYPKHYNRDANIKAAVDAYGERYRLPQMVTLNDIHISSGGTYEIIGDSEFARDVNQLVAISIPDKQNYHAHISLD